MTSARRIRSARARAIAERAHRGQIEANGRPFLDHVRRVTDMVPATAAGVAWLHDVLEWTSLTEDDPVLATLAPHERTALALLTRHGGDDDDGFLSHLSCIVTAPGAAGEIARAVKHADMRDRLAHPRDPAAAWRPPYVRALRVLEDIGDDAVGPAWPRRPATTGQPHGSRAGAVAGTGRRAAHPGGKPDLSPR